MMVRLIFAVACITAGYHFHPFGLSNLVAAAVGLTFSVAVFLFEIRLQRASMRRLIFAFARSVGTVSFERGANGGRFQPPSCDQLEMLPVLTPVRAAIWR